MVLIRTDLPDDLTTSLILSFHRCTRHRRTQMEGASTALVSSFVFDGRRRHPMLCLAIGTGYVMDAKLVYA